MTTVAETDSPMTTSDRVAWTSYAFIFFVLPFIVVLFRAHMQAWHYYLAGLLFLGGALLICYLNHKDP